ncbi:glutamyl-tRNA amidotransferase [Bombardia bombarda]|uniref:Glutamyl-tRNA amidotransferase n=1 Tax=Bombardia bombarda TaxID=252184 RepID=A0AA39X6T9_9PEZI|nr:glutamyl-tRNA amidotransferase [Bombardia bombarda]
MGPHFVDLFILAAISTVAAELTSSGLSVTYNDVYYYISPFSSGNVTISPTSLRAVPSIHGFKPVTVVQGSVARAQLPALLAKWNSTDDVFQPAFAGAIFLTGGNSTCITQESGMIPGASSLLVPLSNSKIPSGPYFLEMATGSLYPVYRLYEDFAGAFMEALIPTPDGRFQPMSAQMPNSASLTVGVPSRLYFTKTADKPLAGVRVGVKDIYRLAGVKGSNGNRAWYNLYPPSEDTASAIQRLVDAGAQIVGLQKTSQFANGEYATADWVDYHEPFNPRGDGYQDSAASSAGAGSSISSYEWMDIAIGSDTGGSIRGPAQVQGLFGNRPSHGLIELDHVMPLAPALDTPGFIVRDTLLWEAANAALYGSNYKSLASTTPRYPTKIYTLRFPTSFNFSDTAPLFIDFANALAKFVGGSVSALNLNDEWAASKPAGVGNVTLSDLLNTTYATIIAKEQISLVRDPFYKDYAAAHDGRTPFINPTPLTRWAYGDSITPAQLATEYRAKQLFMDWFNTEILPPVDDAAQCSDGLLLYIGTEGDQLPRNEYFGPPEVPFGFGNNRISVFSEVPDSVFPLGQVAAKSAITNHVEYLPVAVDVLAAKGCDGLLARLAADLVEAGVLKVPKTGGTMDGGRS